MGCVRHAAEKRVMGRGSLLAGTRVAAYGADDLVLVDELDGEGIIVVSLNAGERHNGLDPPMMIALAEAFDGVTARRAPDPNLDAVRAVILRAEGRSFSVGLDIGNLGDYFETGFTREANPVGGVAD